MKLDFHVHTKFSSDSVILIRDLIKKSKKLGIIPAITDHNNIEAHRHFRALGAQFIPGEEVLTDRGDLIGLYLNEPIAKKTPFSETLDLIHDQGGLAYLPHMFDHLRKGAMMIKPSEIKRIEIIEAFNARCISGGFNEKAEAFAKKHKKPLGAGSDSHFLFEFGSTYAELPEFDIENPKALLKALTSKKANIVKKPAPVLVHGPTKLVSIGKKITHHLGKYV